MFGVRVGLELNLVLFHVDKLLFAQCTHSGGRRSLLGLARGLFLHKRPVLDGTRLSSLETENKNKKIKKNKKKDTKSKIETLCSIKPFSCPEPNKK